MILKGRTTCSGVKCPMEGMCRNKAGLCGAGIGFCSPNSVWESSCPDKIPVNVPTAIISINPTTSPATCYCHYPELRGIGVIGSVDFIESECCSDTFGPAYSIKLPVPSSISI